MYNEAHTINPPVTSFLPWTSERCIRIGEISGNETSTTLSTNAPKLTQSGIKLFPNPASNFIKNSGLTKGENYSIYNILGSKISYGRISHNGKLNVQNLSNGVYLLKFENSTLKFIKE